ncbi:TPA: hypothetical protein ACOEQZ_001258 [Stenotrophomonas maltophilia]
MNAADLIDTLLARPQARWFRDTASGGSALATGVVVAPQELQVLQTALLARQPVGDQHQDDLAVDAFAAAMKAKLAEARAKGRGGWEDPAQCTADDLSRMLRDHVEKGDPRDVANFCMMLHQRGEAIAARQPVGQEPVCNGGFVISNGSGEKYMAWGQVGPEWTADRSAALWLVRRADAEALAAENEDAWSILPVERCALPPNGWACTLASGHEGPCPTIAAPPAQAVGLGQIPQGIRLIEIPRRNNLDPINVFVQDYELGRGRIVVTCYGQAWCGFWGAMGERTVMQFVAACDADYVAGNMLSGRHEHVKKHERTYVERIATEVIAEFRALIDSQAVGNG